VLYSKNECSEEIITYVLHPANGPPVLAFRALWPQKRSPGKIVPDVFAECFYTLEDMWHIFSKADESVLKHVVHS